MQSWVLTLGLSEQSMQFWIDLMQKKPEDIQDTMVLIENQGDSATKKLAFAFLGKPHGGVEEGHAEDVFWAMLIRFHFGGHTNSHVKACYDGLLQRSQPIGYRTAFALLSVGNRNLLVNFGCLQWIVA